MLSDGFGGITEYVHELYTSIDSCATGSLPFVLFYLNFLNSPYLHFLCHKLEFWFLQIFLTYEILITFFLVNLQF